MMEQIDRDVMRTHPDMHFFSGSDGAAVTHREVQPRYLFHHCMPLSIDSLRCMINFKEDKSLESLASPHHLVF